MTWSETDEGECAARGHSPPRSREEREFDRFLAACVKDAARANRQRLKNTRLWDLDDVKQEAYLAAWRKRDRLAALTRDRVRAWIFCVTHNIAVSMFRASKRIAADIDGEVGRCLAAPEAIDHEPLRVALHQALTGFAKAADNEAGAAWYRREILGSSPEEVAADLRRTPSAARRQMGRFMAKNAATLQCVLADFADATC